MARGFNKLIGLEILDIDSRAINSITILCDDGREYEVSAETNHLGIPILKCARLKKAADTTDPTLD